jgi:hypothetical protein
LRESVKKADEKAFINKYKDDNEKPEAMKDVKSQGKEDPKVDKK